MKKGITIRGVTIPEEKAHGTILYKESDRNFKLRKWIWFLFVIILLILTIIFSFHDIRSAIVIFVITCLMGGLAVYIANNTTKCMVTIDGINIGFSKMPFYRFEELIRIEEIQGTKSGMPCLFIDTKEHDKISIAYNWRNVTWKVTSLEDYMRIKNLIQKGMDEKRSRRNG